MRSYYNLKELSKRLCWPVFFIFILFMADPALAFKEWVHDDINETAMENMSFKAPDGSDLIFSLRAIREVQHATRSVDYRNPRDGFQGELLVEEAHCDDELLQECSDRIEELKSNVIELADIRSGKQLRILLGRALHTLQDFYHFTKGMTYIVAALVLLASIGFWLFLTDRDDD